MVGVFFGGILHILGASLVSPFFMLTNSTVFFGESRGRLRYLVGLEVGSVQAFGLRGIYGQMRRSVRSTLFRSPLILLLGLALIVG